MADEEADIEPDVAVERLEVIAEAAPTPGDAGLERGQGHALDPRHHPPEVVGVFGDDRREREPAVAGHHARDAVEIGGARLRVPEELGVVVRMGVDEAGGDYQAAGVDFLSRFFGDFADRDDAPVTDADVRGARGRAGAIDQGPVPDDGVEHGGLRICGEIERVPFCPERTAATNVASLVALGAVGGGAALLFCGRARFSFVRTRRPAGRLRGLALLAHGRAFRIIIVVPTSSNDTERRERVRYGYGLADREPLVSLEQVAHGGAARRLARGIGREHEGDELSLVLLHDRRQYFQQVVSGRIVGAIAERRDRFTVDALRERGRDRVLALRCCGRQLPTDERRQGVPEMRRGRREVELRRQLLA